MSGIAGLVYFDSKPDAAACCARMLGALTIYGPDAGAQWDDRDVALGRRLFRTLPEDQYDRQPLIGADGRFVLVADVRLDNREEVAAELNLSPERTRATCDAAILLAGLERWRKDIVDHVVGDFAFAYWDVQERELVLVRDFGGQRPLFFHRSDRLFAFASMPKGLHALPEVPFAPDEDRIEEWLTVGASHGPKCFFKGIDRVENGQILSITGRRVSTKLYWNPARPERRPFGVSDYVEGLRFHLDQATSSRLRGTNGRVASQLSGGFDSPAVTATAARLMARYGGQVVAITSVPREGYDGGAPENRIADEGPLAAATAGMYSNIEHVLVRANRASPLDSLDRAVYLLDRPVHNICNWVWIQGTYAAARDRHLKVLLNGQWGNMTLSFSGMQLLPELLRRGRIVELLRTGRAMVAKKNIRWQGVLAQAIGPYLPAWTWLFVYDLFRGGRLNVRDFSPLHPDRMDAISARAEERNYGLANRPQKSGFQTRVDFARRTDNSPYGKAALAGWGVDKRDPTADRRLVEFCLSVPTDQFLAGGETRALAKRALADRLPSVVLKERRKGYQAADWFEGLTAVRDDAQKQVEHFESLPLAARVLDLARMRGLIANWPTTGWQNPKVVADYRHALMRGLSAGQFLRRVQRGNS